MQSLKCIYGVTKSLIERTTGVRVFRRNTPWGLSLENDIRKMSPGFAPMVIFDIGANVGQTALRFSRAFPTAKIYSFEPVPTTFETLQKNVNRHPRISVFNVAIGAVVGRAQMISEANSLLSSILKENQVLAPDNKSSAVTVEIDTIDEFAARTKINRIDMMKSDTEGFELDVLKGASTLLGAGAIDYILVEAAFPPVKHKDKITNDKLAASIEKYGYYCVGIYDQEFWPSGIYYGNVLFRLMP